MAKMIRYKPAAGLTIIPRMRSFHKWAPLFQGIWPVKTA
jgi:hypothetical protein